MFSTVQLKVKFSQPIFDTDAFLEPQKSESVLNSAEPVRQKAMKRYVLWCPSPLFYMSDYLRWGSNHVILFRDRIHLQSRDLV